MNSKTIGWKPHHRILWEAVSSPSPTLKCPQCHWKDWICTVLHFQWFTIVQIYQANCAISAVHNCELSSSHNCVLSSYHNCVLFTLALTIVHINCSSDSVQFGRCVKVQAYQNANIELCVSPAVIWSRTKISKETFNLDTFELKISRLNILQKCFVFPFVASHLSLNKMFHFRKLYY